MTLDRFYFRGFQPGAEFEAHADQVLSELLLESPDDTTCLGSIEAGPFGFMALLDLYCQEGPFLGDATAETPEQAFAEVVGKLRAQLLEWKLKRAS